MSKTETKNMEEVKSKDKGKTNKTENLIKKQGKQNLLYNYWHITISKRTA